MRRAVEDADEHEKDQLALAAMDRFLRVSMEGVGRTVLPPTLASLLEAEACQIALKRSPLIALKASPLEARADVPGSPRLSWSGLLGRGDFGVQLAMIFGAIRRGS